MSTYKLEIIPVRNSYIVTVFTTDNKEKEFYSFTDKPSLTEFIDKDLPEIKENN